MAYSGISLSALQRLPVYLEYLRALPESGPENISATSIAAALGLGEVQVRKDLAAVSSSGKPRVGYVTADLIGALEEFLGYNEANNAVIVGAGRLGKALLEYEGFKKYGLNILAAFDMDEGVTGETETGKPVLHISRLGEFWKEMNIKIGIIAVPAGAAQSVCDLLVKSGASAIWNFAPAHLEAPEDILIKSENMAASLAMLSGHLAKRTKENKRTKGV